MNRTTTLHHEASLGAMTLDELGAFVQAAMRAGADGSECPTVRTRMNGALRCVDVSLKPAPETSET